MSSSSAIPKLSLQIDLSVLDESIGSSAGKLSTSKSTYTDAGHRNRRVSTSTLSDAISLADRPDVLAGSSPVIDPATGAVQATGVQAACQCLLDAIGTLKPGEAGRMTQLTAPLNKLLQLATDQADETKALPPSEFAVMCRNHYADASERAARVASRFDPLPQDRLAGANVPAKRDAAAADAYRELSAFLNELKRMHLSAAAPMLHQEYAAQESANLQKKAPGLATTHAGASIQTGVSVSAGGNAGAAGLSGSVSVGQVYLGDDDQDVDYFASHSAAFLAKGSVGIASLLGKLELTGGQRYFEHGDLDTLVQIKVNDDANHSALGSSASPKARKLRTRAQKMANTVKWALGRDYLPEAGAPTYLSDKKVAKGNAALLFILARKLDKEAARGKPGDEPTKPFTAFARSFYPSHARLARHAFETQQALPVASALDRASPLSEPFGKTVPYRQLTAQVQASVGADLESLLGGNFKAGPQAAGSLKYELAQFHLRMSRSAHEILDTSTHHDLRQTFNLIGQLDALLPADPAATALPARLLHYAQFRRELGGAGPGNLPNPGFDAFGPNPPQQFRAAIQNEPIPMLRTAGELCDVVSRRALLLAEEGEKLMAMPDKRTPGSIRQELHKTRSDAFEKLNKELWNDSYPGTEAEALKNPQKFLARTHDALSLGLGLVGVHLHVQKEQQVENAAVLNEGSDVMAKADKKYETARELMDKTFLAIKKDDLVRDHASIVSDTLWQRHNLAAKVQVEGGLTTTNLLGFADPAFESTVNAANSAGKAKVSLQVRAQIATDQPNPARLGGFIENTLTLESGVPFAGPLIRLAVVKAIKKAFPGIEPEAAKLHAKEVVPVVAELLRGVRGGTGGVTVVMKSRKAPGTEGLNLQYVRVLASNSSGVDVSAAPLGVSVGAAVSESRTGVMLEAMGPDLGYNILQASLLTDAVDAFKTNGNADGDDDVDLRAVFQANPWLANKYFTKADTITTLLDRQRNCLDQFDQNNIPAAGQPLPNEFYRYYGDEPFTRAHDVARKTAHHAPGSTARGADPFKAPQPQEHAPYLNKTTTEWTLIKAEVARLKSPADRMNYFCTNVRGKAVMNNFIAVVRDLKEINSATMHHADERNFGFQAKVQPEAFQHQGKPFLHKGKGKALETGSQSSPPQSLRTPSILIQDFSNNNDAVPVEKPIHDDDIIELATLKPTSQLTAPSPGSLMKPPNLETIKETSELSLKTLPTSSAATPAAPPTTPATTGVPPSVSVLQQGAQAVVSEIQKELKQIHAETQKKLTDLLLNEGDKKNG